MNTLTRQQPSAAMASAQADSDGLVPRLLTRWLFRPACVEANEVVAPGLHRIALAGPELRGVPWAAGDKLQIKIGPGLQTRTYTPMEWDPDQGRTAFLAHALAAGPGSEWVRRARPGQTVAVFGPRRSLDLRALNPQRSVLVGDETAIGLAAAWRPARCVLEVDAATDIQPVIDTLRLRASLLLRRAEARHLESLVDATLAAGTDHDVVLVGRAHTIQVVRRALRARGVPGNRMFSKAYWADGKAGLD